MTQSIDLKALRVIQKEGYEVVCSQGEWLKYEDLDTFYETFNPSLVGRLLDRIEELERIVDKYKAEESVSNMMSDAASDFRGKLFAAESKLQEVQRQLGECSGGYETLESELQEVRGELEQHKRMCEGKDKVIADFDFSVVPKLQDEISRLRGELDGAQEAGLELLERIRLLEQKNQALEEVIAGYRKPEIL